MEQNMDIAETRTAFKLISGLHVVSQFKLGTKSFFFKLFYLLSHTLSLTHNFFTFRKLAFYFKPRPRVRFTCRCSSPPLIHYLVVISPSQSFTLDSLTFTMLTVSFWVKIVLFNLCTIYFCHIEYKLLINL